MDPTPPEAYEIFRPGRDPFYFICQRKFHGPGPLIAKLHIGEGNVYSLAEIKGRPLGKAHRAQLEQWVADLNRAGSA